MQRLKGKQGRFRGNLSGKRVDFSARTVISPDPNLGVGEVGVPRSVAMTLTYPARVTPHNLADLRGRVLAGMGRWPGANFVRFPDGGRWFLKYGDRRRIAAELRPGDVVERHLDNGDTVLFNRQPSLHRQSIMAHTARIVPGRTFRFNECVCAPYNADFDGDEMNLHVPQTEEARAEAAGLMSVASNLATPKNGEVLVAATQDFLTAAFLLTSRDTWFARDGAAQLACYAGDAAEGVDLPMPAMLKPVERWTGKQLVGVLVRPRASDGPSVSLETAEKFAVRAAGPACPLDGFVLVRNSELLLGRLGKATLGAGNKAGLFHALASDAGPEAAAAAMGRLAKLAARWIGEVGLSIGVDDVRPSPALEAAKAAAIADASAAAATLIARHDDGTLPRQPGCDARESLETALTGLLNGVREDVSRLCIAGLPRANAPLIMSQCGSKGSPINIAQMVACVGQQSVGGRRCPDGFRGRALPHFSRGDASPAAKGFVASSFYAGLDPTEFFFHAMAGREGLVDTAVKTAETGYMSRRLMKALEDLYAHYDGTVRNAAGDVVQLAYGDDGLDPACMDGEKGAPLDLGRVLASVRGGGGGAPAELPLLPSAMEAVAATAVAASMAGPPPVASGRGSPGLPAPSPGCARGGARAAGQPVAVSPRFEGDVRAVLTSAAAAWRDLRLRLGLPPEERGDPGAELAAAACGVGLTGAEVAAFARAAAGRYEAKRIHPGATVGAVGAQSIGEPGTQMTLKTFHFAGVASMNVTQGVPRLKEIINAARSISTPIVQVALEDASEAGARAVQARLQRTTLSEVAASIEAVLVGRQACVRVVLRHPDELGAGRDEEEEEEEGGEEGDAVGRGLLTRVRRPADPVAAAAAAAAAPSVRAVAAALIAAPKLRLKEEHVRIVCYGGGEGEPDDTPATAAAGGAPPPGRGRGRGKAAVAAAAAAAAAAASTPSRPGRGSRRTRAELHIYPPEDRGAAAAAAAAAAADTGGAPPAPHTLFALHALLRSLPSAVVAGAPSVGRAVLSRDPNNAAACLLTADARDFAAVLATPGVDGPRTVTNHVVEVERVLGIEAARQSVAHEVQYTMSAHGMAVDERHTTLLADCMAARGEVLGITRFGIAKMKESVLMLASFEKTTDHLFDAALRGAVDEITGVSESIIMGAPMTPGTGLFRLRHDVSGRGGGSGGEAAGGGGVPSGPPAGDALVLPPPPLPPVLAGYKPAGRVLGVVAG